MVPVEWLQRLPKVAPFRFQWSDWCSSRQESCLGRLASCSRSQTDWECICSIYSSIKSRGLPDLVEATVVQLASTGRGLHACSDSKEMVKETLLFYARSENIVDDFINFQNVTQSNTFERYCPF